MKKLIVVIIAIVTYNSTNAQGINFEKGTFAEALEKATAEKKLIFIDCYTTWCGPCKKMAKDVFPQPEVGEFMNEKFVNLKINMEQGEGITLVEQYNVKAFPTLLFLDGTGKEVHRVVRGLNAEELLNEANNAADPSKRLDILANKYNQGNRELALVSAYVVGLSKAFQQEKAEKIAQEYIKTMPKEDYKSTVGFSIFGYGGGVPYKSEAYTYIFENRSVFENIEGIGKESVDYVIGSAIRNYVTNVAKTGTLPELKKAIESTKKEFISPRQESLESSFYNQYYLANKMYDTWFDTNKAAADALLESDKEKAESSDISMAYLNIAYQIAVVPTFKEANLYDKAITMMEKVKADDKGFLPMYYCLAELYKNVNNKQLALENVNAFIEMTRAAGRDDDPRIFNLKTEIEKM